jgi:hypothetical protein
MDPVEGPVNHEASMSDIEVRTGQADFPLAKDDFINRYRARFADPASRINGMRSIYYWR